MRVTSQILYSCCGGGASSLAAMRMMAQARIAQTEPKAGEEFVTWAIQPDGVKLYVMRTGNTYRVRNKGEQVIVASVDKPELIELGYIAPEE